MYGLMPSVSQTSLIERYIAFLSLLEVAAVATRRDQAQEPIQRKLATQLARIFETQGRRFIREMARRFAWRFPADDVTESALREAVNEDEWSGLWFTTAAGTAPRMANALSGAAKSASGVAAKQLAGDLGVSFAIPTDPQVLDFLRRESAKLVTRIDAETRRQIQTILADAAAQGRSWGATARLLKAKFDAFAAFAPGPKALRTRAQLIAVTEVGNAFEAGALQAAKLIQADGVDLEKRWLTVGDSRVSAIDVTNAAVGWILLNVSFPSGHERPLSHPGCRCTLLWQRAGLSATQ